MKKAILLLFVAVAFCTSCKKDQKKAGVTPDETYKVSFDLSGLNATVVGNSANGPHTNGLKTDNVPPLSSMIDEIDYFVYDSANKLKHTVRQLSSATNFGSITDNLQAGTYTIYFDAGKTGMNTTGGDIYGYGKTSPYLPWQDTFFKKVILTVGNGDINQSVILDRIVSQLTVNIEDAIPANAYKLTILGPSFNAFFAATGSFGSTLSGDFPVTILIPASAKGTKNFKASIFIPPANNPTGIVLTCYDSSGKPLATATVHNVVLHANTQTILSGQLFGTNKQFGITIDSKWDTISSPL